MVKAMDCGIVVSEFVLQLRYYIHFRANTLGKGMNPLILPTMGFNSTTIVLLGEFIWYWIIYKVRYIIKQRNQTKPKKLLILNKISSVI